MVTHVTSDSFKADVLGQKGLVVVDFWAEWCGPCKRYGPLFEEVAGQLGSKAKFVKLNVDQAEDIAAQYGVMSIPTTLFFKDGEQVDEAVGMLPKDILTQKVQSLA